MKSLKLYQKILSGIVLLLSIVLILLFRNLPTGKLWENYSLLYVKDETPDSIISEILAQNNIDDYVSLSNQFLPLNLSTFSPEISLLKSNYDSSKFSYLKDRDAYFYDKSSNYRLYYIPVKNKNNLGSVTHTLASNNIFYGVDTSANYPFILPLIILAAFGVLIYFSRNRIFFGVASVLPVLFLICNPFYVISISEIMILLCLFFLSNVWKRKNAFLYLISNYAIPLMIFLSFVTAFACNYKVGLLHILCLAGTVSAILLYSEAEEYFKSSKTFIPVYIIPVRRISIFHNKKRIIMPACVASATVIILLFIITSLGNLNFKSSNIMVPAENKSGKITSDSSKLPALDDYYELVWNVKTAPYTSLNDETRIDNHEAVVFPRYKFSNGTINESYEGFEFTDSFKNTVFDEIDDIKFESIEKVLKSQSKDFSGTYVSTSSYSTSLFGIIALLFSYFVLLFFYISIMIKRGSKK